MRWDLRLESPGPATRVEIACGASRDLLRDLEELSGTFFLVLDQGFQEGHKTLAESLSEKASGVALIPGGESHKTPEQLIRLCSHIVGAGLGRGDRVVVLGGGAVLDLGGLAAALVLRGLPLIQVPTTLLSAVDACLGGKCAVDLPEGRNLLGAFHFAERIVVDPELLGTLPKTEFSSGLGEVAKYGLGFSKILMDWLREIPPLNAQTSPKLLEELVHRCLRIKSDVVLEDPWEKKGLRRTLNLGHSLAHALEALAGPDTLNHGNAVALGLRAELRIGKLSPSEQREGEAFLDHLGLPNAFEQVLPSTPKLEELRVFFSRDKKREGEWIHEPRIHSLGGCHVERLKASSYLEDAFSALV